MSQNAKFYYCQQGTLPLRVLSLRYGADLVYTEEIIDKRIIATTRVVNGADNGLCCGLLAVGKSQRLSFSYCYLDVVGCVDFIANNGESVVFRTSPEEQGKVVFQIGTADSVLALQAAQQV